MQISALTGINRLESNPKWDAAASPIQPTKTQSRAIKSNVDRNADTVMSRFSK